MDSLNITRQAEIAAKLQEIQAEATGRLSATGWFLLVAAIISLPEPTKTPFPKLSHSESRIGSLGPTYRLSFERLTKDEKETIQFLYRRFIDSLSYGQPSVVDLMD